MTQGPWGQKPQRPRNAPRPRLGLLLWLGVMGAAALLLWVLSAYFPSGQSQLGDPYLLYTVAWLAAASTSLLFIREVNLKQTARNILLWIGAGAVILLAYAYQDDLFEAGLRLRAELVPGYARQTSAHSMVISESEGGSYQVYGTVNGTRVLFLVDTGASEIVLSPADAKRAGIDLASLSFEHPYGTANGIGHGASYRVAKLTVGNMELADVPVSIDGAEMSTSLLGMTFLKRLKSFGFSQRKLYLQW